jgi:hypothetical protein
MTMNFMETSELTITQMTFDTANDNITLSITNSGTSDVVVSQVRVNGNPATSFTMTPSTGFTAGSTDGTIELNYATGVNPGSKYAVSLFANDGTMIGSYTDTA